MIMTNFAETDINKEDKVGKTVKSKKDQDDDFNFMSSLKDKKMKIK